MNHPGKENVNVKDNAWSMDLRFIEIKAFRNSITSLGIYPP